MTIITLKNGSDVEAGTWLDGAHGWTNGYRVVDIATSHGWTLSAEDAAIVEWYRSSDAGEWGDTDDELNDMESMTGQGGISDQATDYLSDQLPDGWVTRWDAGEFSVLRDWEDCAADGNGCETGTDRQGNVTLVKRCTDHNPCEGHHDDDRALTIGGPYYCNGSCAG